MKPQKNIDDFEIKLLILDVDGVLTNGKIIISDDGIESKSFDVRDGVGMVALMKNGVEIAIISGRNSEATSKRLTELGVKHSYLGIKNKIETFNQLKEQLNLKDNQIAYVGDDIPDIEVMKQVGFSMAVADATEPAKEVADLILKNRGGDTAVREACDLILESISKKKKNR